MNWKGFENNLSCPNRSTKTVHAGGTEEDYEISQTEYPMSRLDSNCVFLNANLGPFRYTPFSLPTVHTASIIDVHSKQSVLLSTHRAIFYIPLFILI